MKQKKELLLILAVLAIVGALTREPAQTTPPCPAPSKPDLPKGELVEITFEQFCPHGTCGHNAPWWELTFDGRQNPATLVASEFDTNGQVTRTVTHEVSDLEFQRMLREMAELGLSEWMLGQHLPHYNPYFCVDSTLSFSNHSEPTIHRFMTIGDDLLLWFEKEPAARSIKAELNPRFSYCSR